MSKPSSLRTAAGALAIGVGVGLSAYGTYAAVSWYRYGRVPQPHGAEYDQLLDRFMPAYDVVERHRIRVAAPPAATLAAAREQDLFRLPRARDLPNERARPEGHGGRPFAAARPACRHVGAGMGRA